MRKISAKKIYTNTGEPLADAVVLVDSEGKILAIESTARHDPSTVEFFDGILVPGFVNAHCHLELSHMKGRVPTGTGLVKFIEGVVSLRDTDPNEIQEAIDAADQEMHDAGIVAVGDICNRTDTFQRKDQSAIHYHSFVEMFDFWQDHLAQKTFDDYKLVYDQTTNKPGHHKSAVPHAPYSVSKTLFRLINELNSDVTSVSIHNQETMAEEAMFRNKEGDFLRLFGQFGFSFDHFEPIHKASVFYAIEHMDARHRHLFVHNTLTRREEVEAVKNWNIESFWVSCPNANLYIENRLPDYRMFMDMEAKVCLGTDSLTSNWQLSILEEIKAIRRYQSFVPQEELIRWACYNGAEALGIADRYGSIEIGKTPGINHITVNSQDEIDHYSQVIRIF